MDISLERQLMPNLQREVLADKGTCIFCLRSGTEGAYVSIYLEGGHDEIISKLVRPRYKLILESQEATASRFEGTP